MLAYMSIFLYVSHRLYRKETKRKVVTPSFFWKLGELSLTSLHALALSLWYVWAQIQRDIYTLMTLHIIEWHKHTQKS